MKIQNVKIGDEIFLTTHKREAIPSYFEIINNSIKALQLKNSVGKTLWIPKSVLKYDIDYKCFYLVDWFRKKMEIWQLAIIQS